MKTVDFYYDLPQELIAQDPLEDRSSSRLMHLSLQDGSIEHRHFTDVLDYLEEEPFVGENVYVFCTDNVKDALNWQGPQGTSLGEYLQGLLENHPESGNNQAPTLRELFHSRYQNGMLPALPVIRFPNGEIEVNLV